MHLYKDLVEIIEKDQALALRILKNKALNPAGSILDILEGWDRQLDLLLFDFVPCINQGREELALDGWKYREVDLVCQIMFWHETFKNRCSPKR
jgi:hypothetical protein